MNESTATVAPAKKYTPIIVEYHAGSSAIIQSIAAKVEVRAKSKVPTGASPRSRALMATSPVSSCFWDWVEKYVARLPQTTK